jgi:hypothetical protein
VQSLLNDLWLDYLELTPYAKQIHRLFESKQETIVNDHIALRTFNRGSISLEAIVNYLDGFGYTPRGEYTFEEKKLNALHFEHRFDANAPKIFVSELLLEQMPQNVQAICQSLIDEADEHIAQSGFRLPMMPWRKISTREYLELREVSEYAAWTATFGLRANHFTVSVNKLRHLASIEDVNNYLKQAGFELNTSGGEIKGSEEVCLKQSSTMANLINWSFSDGEMEIRSCFYEFAERFVDPKTGSLYQGFVASSADKIFESTNVTAAA